MEVDFDCISFMMSTELSSKSARAAAATLLVVVVILAVCLTGTVAAYYLGNFPINHFTRLEVGVDNTRPRYVADIAEIATL